MSLFLDRLEHEHDTTFVDSRKALSFKDGLKLHQVAGLFLTMLAKLELVAPSRDFPAMRSGLLDQFMHGYLDADLQHVLEQSVPPGDPNSIGGFRRPPGPLVDQQHVTCVAMFKICHCGILFDCFRSGFKHIGVIHRS